MNQVVPNVDRMHNFGLRKKTLGLASPSALDSALYKELAPRLFNAHSKTIRNTSGSCFFKRYYKNFRLFRNKKIIQVYVETFISRLPTVRIKELSSLGKCLSDGDVSNCLNRKSFMKIKVFISHKLVENPHYSEIIS